MNKDIRLIAFDLDETLLNSDKTLSQKNKETLLRAAESGIYLVPATGRLAFAVPDCVRALPYQYVIAANGAEVTQTDTGDCIYSAYIPNARAVDLMRYFDTLPVAYDCYMGDKAFMAEKFLDAIEEYIGTPAYIEMARRIRIPVPYLPDHLLRVGQPLKKLQLFTRDPIYKAELIKTLTDMCPDLAVTASTPENIEINAREATKGNALKALCRHLGISPEQAMAFGDSFNDITMISVAGLGVAMENAEPEVRRAADYITLNNNESGVAAAVEKFCF